MGGPAAHNGEKEDASEQMNGSSLNVSWQIRALSSLAIDILTSSFLEDNKVDGKPDGPHENKINPPTCDVSGIPCFLGGTVKEGKHADWK